MASSHILTAQERLAPEERQLKEHRWKYERESSHCLDCGAYLDGLTEGTHCEFSLRPKSAHD